MKKIISMFTVAATVLAMSSFSAFAAYESTLTMSSNATDNKANVGDEVIVTVKAGTTNGMKALGFKITFDAADIELGTSAQADATAEEYAEYIGTADYPTLDAVCNEVLGRPSFVDDEYYGTYDGLSSSKKFDSVTRAYEEKGGKGLVTFGYAGEKAKGSLAKVEPFNAAGAVLKIKTSEKKQTTITITEATAAGSDGVDTPSTISNTITLDLNGYTAGGDEGDDELTAEKAEGADYDTYTFENLEEGSVLAGKKVLMQKEKAPVSGITEKTRFVVSDGTRTQIFGGDIWDKLNVEGEGAVKAVNVIFGLIVDAANTSTFTFDVQ